MTDPKRALASEIFCANARLWRAQSGGRMRAVLKSDGYGWGMQRIAVLIEDVVEGFCVVDASEFRALREHTRHPITLLGFCRVDEIVEMLDYGALPNVASLEELAVVIDYVAEHQRIARIRAGLSPSLGWNGIEDASLEAFAARAAATEYIELELWTHLTSPQAQAEELAAFDRFTGVFRRHQARIVGIDIANSASIAHAVNAADAPSRIGIGLFGAFRAEIPTLRCALSIDAYVIDRQHARASLVAGYARVPLPPGAYVETLRIGYGNGFPRGLIGAQIDLGNGKAVIATIGMQHTVITHDLPPAETRSLIHAGTNLEGLCSGTNISVHELVVGLGNPNS